MQQKLQKFRGDTLDEAYRNMRTALGNDAVVLSTNEVIEGGVLGFRKQKKVELTAAAADVGRPPESAGTRKPVAGGAARKRSAAERKYIENAPPGSEERVTETIHYFQNLVKEAKQRIAQASVPEKENPPRPAAAPPVRRVAAQRSTSAREEPARQEMAREERGESVDDLRAGLCEMQETLHVIMTEMTGAGPHKEFAEYYRLLVDRGVSRRAAATLISRVVRGGDGAMLRDRRVFRERLKFQVRRLVKVTGGIALEPGVRRTVAFVGATGVGKTTNLAKLAAEFAVRERVKVALITCDTYRIAAPEQLRVYADIIGLPMKVVNDAREMAAAVHEFRGHDLVLIDTAGGSQFNLDRIAELKDVLAPARPDEVHLLMGCNTQLHELHNTAANFRCLNPTALFFTKLDETRQYGAMLSAYVESDLPLSYLSVGQDVPDDIELASPARVANLIVEDGENRDRSSSKSA